MPGGILCFKQCVKKEIIEDGEDIYDKKSCDRYKLYNLIFTIGIMIFFVPGIIICTPISIVVRVCVCICIVAIEIFNLKCIFELANIAKGKSDIWLEKYFAGVLK